MKRLPLLFFLFYSILGYAQKQNSVRNDKAFMVLSDLRLHAFDAETGKVLWTTEKDSAYANPVLADSTIYVRTIRNKIIGYHVLSGKKVWESQLSFPYQNTTSYINVLTGFSSPAIANGLIYAALERKNQLGKFDLANPTFDILAIDLVTGKIRWTYEMPYRSSNGTTREYRPIRQPQIHRNALYVQTSLSFLALNASTGSKLWEIDFPYSEIGAPRPAGYQNYIFMARHNFSSDLTSGIEAYDAQTGRKLWENKQIDNGSTIEIADTILYVGDGAGYLFALELTTGKVIWKVKVPGKHISISIDHEQIHVIGDKLSLYSKIDGTLQWQIEDKDFTPFNVPTLANEVLYLVGSDAFHAIDALTGRRKWSTTFKPHTISISQYPLIIDLNNKGYYPSSSPMKYIK